MSLKNLNAAKLIFLCGNAKKNVCKLSAKMQFFGFCLQFVCTLLKNAKRQVAVFQ